MSLHFGLPEVESQSWRKPATARHLDDLPLCLPQLALYLPRHLPAADRLSLVIDVLAPGQRDLDLGVRTGEVDPGRDQRQPALGRLADQPLDLLAVQQQLARALRIVVAASRGTVRRDVHPEQPHLTVPDGG